MTTGRRLAFKVQVKVWEGLAAGNKVRVARRRNRMRHLPVKGIWDEIGACKVGNNW